MRLTIDAEPDELVQKSEKLVEVLSNFLQDVSPDVAESLEKALPPRERELKLPVLQHLHDQMVDLYEQQMWLMVDEIIDVVLGGITKSENVAYRRAKEVLLRQGWSPEAFESGGQLEGYSTNQLLDLARSRQAG